MPRQPDNWPAGCLPRMMDVKFAAYHCGVCPTTFLARVEAGILPKGRRDGKRVLWDLTVLNRALDRLSGIAGTDQAEEDLVAADEEKAFAMMRARCESGAEQKLISNKADPIPPMPSFSPEAMAEWMAMHDERNAKNAAVDNDPAAIERILSAHRAGDAKREIAKREGLTGQKVDAIIRRIKRPIR